MAERSDIHVEWWRSPRLIVVEAPSTELTVQDLVDTIRGLQESTVHALDDKKLLDASGKDSLEGAAQTVITATLQNAQVAFEQRPTPHTISTATANQTTDGLPGVILTDSTATFLSGGVMPGDVAVNFTDGSVATVIEALSDTQLKTYTLQAGIGNTWDSGDAYGIWHMEECKITAGNVVAVDVDGVTPISSISSTAFVSVSKEAASSGTTVESGVSGLTPAESQALLDIAADQATITADIGTINTNIGSMDATLTLIAGDISSIDTAITAINLSIASIDSSIVTINTNIGTIQTDISNLAAAQQFMADIEGGDWEIEIATNQMVFYKSDHTTEIARFDLTNATGSPTTVDVYKRRRV